MMTLRTCIILVLLAAVVQSGQALSQQRKATNTGTALSYISRKVDSVLKWLVTRKDTNTFDYIAEINRVFGLNLFEGDIQGYHPTHRAAVRERSFLWNTRVVPYTIDSSIDTEGRRDIASAIEEYHSKTCIRWVPRTTEIHFVTFKQVSGCYSIIGRAGGEQVISLTKGCTRKGTVIHEMMHALGFWHEQSRPDRDPWVQVIYGNIQEGKEFNFEKLTTSLVDTLGVAYDYGSIMHYSRYAFTRNGEPTILPVRDPDAFLGQREGLSPKDILRIRTLYRCDATYPIQESTTMTKIPSTQPTTPPPTTQTTVPSTQTTQSTIPSTQTTQSTVPTTQQTVPTTQKLLPTTQKSIPTTETPTSPDHTTQKPVQTTQKPLETTSNTPPPTSKTTSAIAVTSTQVTSESTSSNPSTRPAPVTLFPPVGWTMWGAFGTCDFNCKKTRHRFCLNFDPSYCPGPDVEVEDCPLPCRVTYSFGCWRNDPANPTMSSNEGLFPDLVDDYRTRTNALRKCNDVASTLGHVVFALTDGGKCVSDVNALSTFSSQGPSSECREGKGGPQSSTVYSFVNYMDGAWSLWTGWSQCTRTCGGGQRFRYRACNNPPAIGGGRVCQGASEDFQPCNTQSCIEESKCGVKYLTGELGTSGYIVVSDYDNFMTCEYVITTGRPNSTLSLDIERLDVEYSTSCSYDALLVFDGANETAPLAGVYCGSGHPAIFQSSSHTVFLRFQSDSTTTGRGFTIAFTVNAGPYKACVEPPLLAHGTVLVDSNTVGHSVLYRCDPGFHLVGSQQITCLDQPGKAVWSDRFPVCLSDFRRSLSTPRSLNLCTFQDNLCSFHGDSTAAFKWIVKTADAAAVDEAIPADGDDGYLFVEANPAWRSHDVARAVSPSYEATPTGRCLSFRYKSDAFPGALRVLLRAQNQEEVTPLWTSPKNASETWQEAVVQFRRDAAFEIIFEAAVGERYGSWVALDDVIVFQDGC